MDTQKQTHILYHGNCPDGFGAALAAWQIYDRRAAYIPVSYGNPPPELPERCNVYVLDFSYPKETLHALAATRGVWVLDHHKSAQEDLVDMPGLYDARSNLHVCFDMEESGATLAWKFFHAGGPHEAWTNKRNTAVETRLPLFFKYLRDRDLWQWALPHSKEVSLYLWSQPRDFGVWDSLIPLYDNALEFRMKIVEPGIAISRYADKLVEEQARRFVLHTITGYDVPVVNATTLFSEVGDWLCQQHPDRPFVAYYFDRNDGKRQWGLRARGNFDCSAVARQFGGGGHAGAAGFVTAMDWYPWEQAWHCIGCGATALQSNFCPQCGDKRERNPQR